MSNYDGVRVSIESAKAEAIESAATEPSEAVGNRIRTIDLKRK
jgi:hypothetical protein